MRSKIVKIKSNAKSKIVILITVGIFLALLPINTNTHSDSIAFDNEILKTSAVSGKISINGNSGWTSFKAAGNCTGDGTYSVPYVIEDLVINGTGSGSGIRIQNSDVFFKIENCTIFNVPQPDAGIWLNNVKNGSILDNTVSFNWQGITLDPNCENNTIQGNTAISDSDIGINLWESNSNYVKENTVNNSGAMGINLEPESSYNEIVNNTVIFNGWVGIRLAVNSTNNIIHGNNVNSNTDIGILLSESSNNSIKENTVNSNGAGGITLESNSENNTIQGNSANSNGGTGISLETDSSYNKIVDNTATSNGWVGIAFTGNSGQNLAISNNINDHTDGIFVEAANNTISENDIYGNGKGIVLSGFKVALSNNITRNIIRENGEGIFFDDDCSQNIIEGNEIYDNSEVGVRILTGSHHNLIFNNSFTNNLFSHAYDNGESNHWDNGTLGNYWDDYSGDDANDDGIGDTPYDVIGTSASAQDNFPIWDDGPEPEIPEIPGYNLFFLLGTISVVAIVISTKLKKFNK